MKKKILRALALAVVPFLGMVWMRFLYLTNKKIFHLPNDIPKEPVVFAFWHGDLLMQPYLYYQFRKIPKANVLISDHFDGSLISKTMRYFKLGTIAGSSNRNGAKVLIQAIKTLKNGYDIGITPDGPKGPRHSVQEGIVAMAQKTKSKIICFTCKPSKYWQLRSWDGFVIPKPFGTLEFFASEPIDVSGMPTAQAAALVQERLLHNTGR
jgi:lysophospholipid acyltransferase (LPLAT)-like uncharacterized protein